MPHRFETPVGQVIQGFTFLSRLQSSAIAFPRDKAHLRSEGASARQLLAFAVLSQRVTCSHMTTLTFEKSFPILDSRSSSVTNRTLVRGPFIGVARIKLWNRAA